MPALDDAGSTISNATLQAILRRLATMQEDAVIFTTFAARGCWPLCPSPQPVTAQPEGSATRLLPDIADASPQAVTALPSAADRPEALDMLRNMCAHLQLQGLLRHTLLITSDEG